MTSLSYLQTHELDFFDDFQNSLEQLKNAILDVYKHEIVVQSPHFPFERRWFVKKNVHEKNVQIFYLEKYYHKRAKQFKFVDLCQYTVTFDPQKICVVTVDKIYLSSEAQALRADMDVNTLGTWQDIERMQKALKRSDFGIGKGTHPAASDVLWLAVEIAKHCAESLPILNQSLFVVNLINARNGHLDETLQNVQEFYVQVINKIKTSFVYWQPIQVTQKQRGEFISVWRKTEDVKTHTKTFVPRVETWLKL